MDRLRRIRDWLHRRGISGRRRRNRPRAFRMTVHRKGVTRIESAVAAYRRAGDWGSTLSRFAQEEVGVPAYEDRALRGERPPRRFCWRGRWYRVLEVAAEWRDSRRRGPAHPKLGRSYFNLIAEPDGLVQVYYERLTGGTEAQGKWILYRRTQIRQDRPRPAAGSG